VKLPHLKKRPLGGLARQSHGFTLIELMVALAIVGILSVFGMQAMLQNQKGSRKNEFDNEVNAAMAEITRLTTDPVTCSSSFHSIGVGNSTFAQAANKFTNWTKVPRFIYDSNALESDTKNIISINFPLNTSGQISETGTVQPFRGSKIVGIRSVYLAPPDYPRYEMQTNVGSSNGFKGNVFVEITFEYIGPANTVIGMKTRTKLLPLSVTWAKFIRPVFSANLSAAEASCVKLGTSQNCTPTPCTGQLVDTCNEDDNNGLVVCNCAVFQPGISNWKISACNAIGSG
jgi:prepilin-type N-terminal cleavage/methylation domain-containing protein